MMPYLGAVMALTLSAPTQEPQPASDDGGGHSRGEVEWAALVSSSAWLERPVSWDPDEPRIELSWLGGRAHGMIGGHLALVAARRGSWATTFGLSPFLLLENFEPSDLVPWSMFRANFAFASHSSLQSPKMRRVGLGLFLDIRYAHESDHMTAGALVPAEEIEWVYVSSFTQSVAVASSFEYVELRLGARWLNPSRRLQLHFYSELRLFPPPVVKSSIRRPLVAVAAELGARYQLRRGLSLVVGSFFEQMHHAPNRFYWQNPGSGRCVQPTCSRSLLVRAGVSYTRRNTRSFTLFMSYDHMSGRGLDYTWDYGHEFGGGILYLF